MARPRVPPTSATSRGRRLALVVVVWLAALLLGWRAWLHFERHRRVDRTCASVVEGRLDAALAASEELIGVDPPGLRAAECRALALVGTERPDEAMALLEGLIEDPAAGGWLPSPLLVGAVVEERRHAGRLQAAVELARRATAAYPQDPDLLRQELAVRSEAGNEAEVLEDFLRRLPTMGEVAARFLRVDLAERFIERGAFERAAGLLTQDPPQEPPLRRNWYRVRAQLAAAQADTERLVEVCDAWRAWADDPSEALAWQAVLLSLYNLLDPALPTLPALEAAAARAERIDDPRLLQLLYTRLIGSYIVNGRHAEALAVYESTKDRFDLGYTPEDIHRSEEQSRLGEAALLRQRGLLRFAVAGGSRPGDQLLVSPDATEPVDTPFEPHELRPGEPLTLRRSVGTAPQRWVYRDRDGRTLASGATWPARGTTVDVVVQPRAPLPRSVDTPRRRAPDGRRRVFVVVLDCADWRLVQYLRARGEMPAVDAMVRRGLRAVLESDPPFTAAAIDSIVHPSKRVAFSVPATLFQLGKELASNTFVETNPFAVLASLLPERRSLFEVIGATDHVALNYLHSSGEIRGGRHAEVSGPRGSSAVFRRWQTSRPLSAAERAGFARSTPTEPESGWAEEAAADFDAADRIAGRRDVDLLVLRVPTLDLATHSGYPQVSETGQDDGRPWLFSFYRYLDARLDAFERRLDADDVLIVMSDHGIRTAMEHDPRAVFVASGGGVPHDRVAGAPALRGIPRLLAELLGVDTDWPASGIEAWAAALRGQREGGVTDGRQARGSHAP